MKHSEGTTPRGEVADLLRDCATRLVEGLDDEGRADLLGRLADFFGAGGAAFLVDRGPMLRELELVARRGLEAAANLRSVPARAWVDALAAGRAVRLARSEAAVPGADAGALGAEFCDWLGVETALLLPVRRCGELEGLVLLANPAREAVPGEALAVAGLLGNCAAPRAAAASVPAAVVRHACHEMRNALNALLSGAEFLDEELRERSDLPEDVGEVIADMLTASERAERALGDLHSRAVEAG